MGTPTGNGEAGTPPIDLNALTRPDLRELMVSLGLPVPENMTLQETDAALAVAQLLPDQAWGLLLNPGMAVRLEGSQGLAENSLGASLSTVQVAPGGERSQVLELSASVALEAGLRSEALRGLITPELIERLPEGTRQTVRGWRKASEAVDFSIEASAGERFTYQATVPPDVGARIADGDMSAAPNPVDPMNMPVGSSVLIRGESFTAQSMSVRYRLRQFDETLTSLEGQGLGIRRVDDSIYEVTTGPMAAMERDAFLGVGRGDVSVGISRETRLEGQAIAVAHMDLSTPEGQAAYASFMQTGTVPSTEVPGVTRVGERGQLSVSDRAALALNAGPLGVSVGTEAALDATQTRWSDGTAEVQTVWRYPGSGTYSLTHSVGADGTVDASSRRWTATFQNVDGAAAQRMYANFSEAGGPRVGFPERVTVNMSFTESDLMQLRDQAVGLNARPGQEGGGRWEQLAQAQDPNEVFRQAFLLSTQKEASAVDGLFGAMHAQSDAGALPGHLGFLSETTTPVQVSTRGQPGSNRATPGIDGAGSGWVEVYQPSAAPPDADTSAPSLIPPSIQADGPTLPADTDPAPRNQTAPVLPTPEARTDSAPLPEASPAQPPMVDTVAPRFPGPVTQGGHLDHLVLPGDSDPPTLHSTTPVMPTPDARGDTAPPTQPLPAPPSMVDTAAPSRADPVPPGDSGFARPGEAAPPMAMASPPATPTALPPDAPPATPQPPPSSESATVSAPRAPGYDMQDGLLRPGEEGIGVSGLQNALRNQGHDLPTDGRFGTETEQALRDFQARNGLQVDGIAGPESFAALDQRSAGHMADGLIRQPDHGVGVLGSQTALRQLGQTLAVDGAFGPDTERAVRAFQQASGLAVDGMVGPHTSAALLAAQRALPNTPNSEAANTQAPPGSPTTLTPDQQRHLQLARDQLGPALSARGQSPEQIERICAAAVSHAQQHADRGPVSGFFLSKDGERVAVVQQSAPMSEMSVAAAGQRSSEQHLAQARQLAIAQEQTAPSRSQPAPAMTEYAR